MDRPNMMFHSEGENQFSKRQKIVTLIFAIFLLAIYLFNIVPRTGSDIKINNLWVFFFPLQIMTTLYSVWRYTTQSENWLFLQSGLLLFSWFTRFTATFDPLPFVSNSYFIYDLSTTFEIGIKISMEEILYTIFSITAIGLSIQPLVKRRRMKKLALASIG